MQTIKGVKNVRKLFALSFACLSLVTITSFSPAAGQSAAQTASQTTSRLPAAPRLAAYPFAGQPNITMYDEQLGTSFTQNFTSLAYNITATAQTGTDGYGPAYLVNGLGNTGYWYQVGLSYDWDGSTATGFQLAYEVFNSSDHSVYPALGGGGMAPFSPVNAGDTILLSLTFANGNVVMQATDQTTGAQAQKTYSAMGATSFIGSPSAIANSNGFFTGLMTEWYHTVPYYGDQQKETYTTTSAGISSAWLWMDEFSVAPNGTIGGLFGKNSPAPISFSSNPTQLQSLTSNGATVAENATQFVSGTIALVSLTFSYSITGGGSAPAPVLTYVTSGVQKTATLTQSSQAIQVDNGSAWSTTSQLSSSAATERWQTNQATTGTASAPQTISLVYYHQYLVTFAFNITGGGTNYSAPSVNCQQFGSAATQAAGTPVWADAGPYSFPTLLTGSSDSERWDAPATTSGTISATGSITTEYYHQFLTIVNYAVIDGGTPGAPTFNATYFGTAFDRALTTQPQNLWVDSSASYSIDSLLPGSNATERWLPKAATTGTVNASGNISVSYFHQYYVTFSQNSADGGSISSKNDWYEAGISVQANASANGGWQFENWSGSGTGSYSGTDSSGNVTIDSPVTETAVFYPGLTMTVSGKISVYYTYGTVTGAVPAGAPETIYAPVGTSVQLTAKPKSFIYSFAGWTGAVTDNKSSIATVLDAPQNINADFAYNYRNIGLIAAGIIIVIAAAIILIIRRKKKPTVGISG